jgi:hypothetical protein
MPLRARSDPRSSRKLCKRGKRSIYKLPGTCSFDRCLYASENARTPFASSESQHNARRDPRIARGVSENVDGARQLDRFYTTTCAPTGRQLCRLIAARQCHWDNLKHKDSILHIQQIICTRYLQNPHGSIALQNKLLVRYNLLASGVHRAPPQSGLCVLRALQIEGTHRGCVCAAKRVGFGWRCCFWVSARSR